MQASAAQHATAFARLLDAQATLCRLGQPKDARLAAPGQGLCAPCPGRTRATGEAIGMVFRRDAQRVVQPANGLAKVFGHGATGVETIEVTAFAAR
jgi:hypothetical protein